jgi:hypothetical protein
MKRQHLASLSFSKAKVSLKLNLLEMEGAHPLAKLRYWLVFYFYILTLTSKYQKCKVKELYLELSMDRNEHDSHVQSNM